MKRYIHSLILSALILGLASSTTAQTLATSTTLGAAATETQTTITVASATGFTAGNMLYVDYEAMRIVSVSALVITVNRGQMGTSQRPHDSGRTVLTGNAAHFQVADPDFLATCVRGAADAAYLPWINVRTGNVFVCRITGAWAVTNLMPITYNSLQLTG